MGECACCMKKKFDKVKWMILLMIALVVVSVSITILVVMHMVSKQTAKIPQNGAIQETNEQILVENVYITECGDNWITFLYQGGSYRFRGQIAGGYSGVADIYFLNNKIDKIALKRTTVHGTLLSCSEDQIEVEGYGLVEKAASLAVYRIVEGQVETSDFSGLFIGEENLSYVVAEGKICAVIQNEDDIQVADKKDTIRVLLKNGENITYQKLYITGSKEWMINGAIQKADDPVDMVSVIRQTAEKTDRQSQTTQLPDVTMVHTAQAVCNDGFLYITDENGTKLGNGYEGIFLVREWEDGVVLINQIGIEDYVRYVLPSEMESTFPFEAQKAQAVCARTFAYAQMQNKTYAAYGANVDDSTSFQVYNRFGTSSMTDLAVEETKGQLMVYDDQPITCYYFSTSNGFTEDMGVWGEENPPYIAAQSLLLSDNTSVGRLSLRTNYIDFLQETPQSYDSDSPYYRWNAILDLDAYTDDSLGKIKSITLTKRSTSGYVRSMDICYEKMTQTLTDENEIRKFIGKLLCEVTLADGTKRTDMAMLPSASFVITGQDGQKYTLSGGGFGHGIGMSQYAAGKMAELGMDYREILVFFYKNAFLAQSR